MRAKVLIRLLLLVLAVTGLQSCLSYYQRQLDYQDAIYSRNYLKADKILEKSAKKKGRNYLLYLLDRGFIYQQLGNYAASNACFLEADILMEDARKNTGSEALALISNPMMKPYQAEDFEIILIHYYLAMNYLQLGNYESALVECRRMNLRLQVLNDKYEKKNRYSCDAFAHLLSGLIYESELDWNNAFIAYRNAYNCYKDVYVEVLGQVIPHQLKKDLIRAAYKTGFYSEQEFYENQFNLKYSPEMSESGSVILFLNYGLGPVKAENSFNFTMLHGAGGMVNFVSDDKTLSFPFYLPPSDKDRGALGNLQIIRVAFPKYIERKPVYSTVDVRVQEQRYSSEIIENINEIAFKTLEDRMLREMGNSLLRLAVKKGIEHTIRQQDQTLGALAGLAGAITEKADTRNWQTLPYGIRYLRIPLSQGSHIVEVEWEGSSRRHYVDSLNISLNPGEMKFIQLTAPESYSPE